MIGLSSGDHGNYRRSQCALFRAQSLDIVEVTLSQSPTSIQHFAAGSGVWSA